MQTYETLLNYLVPGMNEEGVLSVDYRVSPTCSSVWFPYVSCWALAEVCVFRDESRTLGTFHGPDGLYHTFIFRDEDPDCDCEHFVSRFNDYPTAKRYGFVQEPLEQCSVSEPSKFGEQMWGVVDILNHPDGSCFENSGE